MDKLDELLELAIKKIDVLEKKVERYYALLKVENEIDFILKGTYALESEIEEVLEGNY